MKLFQLKYKQKAFKSLKQLPKTAQQKILNAIEYLAEDPFLGKKLKGKLSGKYSLRLWPYRVIYIVKKEEIIVVILDIGHRQGVYKK